MSQTLAPPPSPAAPQTGAGLFDLLARAWVMEDPVVSVAFDAAGKSAGFALGNGRVAMVLLDDAESPVSRYRFEIDSGRSTIRPRSRPPAPPVLTDPLGTGAVALAPSGQAGLIAAARDGRLWRVTPRGQTVALWREGKPIGALASDGRGGLAIAQEGKVSLLDEATLDRRHGLLTPGMARALAFAPQGDRLAVQEEGGLVIWRPGAGSERHLLDGSGPMVFSASGRWLAGSDGLSGFWLLRCEDGATGQVGNFRSRPVSLAFGPEDRSVFVGGAFRLAGWSLATPPLRSETEGALRSGRPGLVVIERVAAHPQRDLVAFGAADGTVAMAHPGLPDEMELRHADGAPVTALAWSADGQHLAIGTAGGALAMVSFPPQMFK
jgi:hypothetical protein